jgi:hypothetical protein
MDHSQSFSVCLATRNPSIKSTRLANFGKETVDSFASKEDLIRCNMASVHLPFPGRPYIDGSFLAKAADYDRGLNRSVQVPSMSINRSGAIFRVIVRSCQQHTIFLSFLLCFMICDL